MKIYKEIEIDLNKWANKIHDPKMNYTEIEQEKLAFLYADFRRGRFDVAMKYVDGWTHEERELIPCEIWDVLLDVNVGVKYKVE